LLSAALSGLGPLVVRELRPGDQPFSRLCQAFDAPPRQPLAATERIDFWHTTGSTRASWRSSTSCARRTASFASKLGGRGLRFTDDQRRRLAVKGRIVGRRRLGEFAGLVTPDTILRWYRELIARKYDGSARRRTGRPTVASDVERLVVRIATENPTWGYTRLVGALDNLGHQRTRNRTASLPITATW
jgi:hypothetical protein